MAKGATFTAVFHYKEKGMGYHSSNYVGFHLTSGLALRFYLLACCRSQSCWGSPRGKWLQVASKTCRQPVKCRCPLGNVKELRITPSWQPARIQAFDPVDARKWILSKTLEANTSVDPLNENVVYKNLWRGPS